MKKKLFLLLLAVIMLAAFVIPAGAASLPFKDVSASAWYYDAVNFVYGAGLFGGTGETTFSPDMSMSRAMLVTVLYRDYDMPDVEGVMPFTDVADGTWYHDAVLWAAQNNIVNGTDERTFSPNAFITREQMVAIMYRYSDFLDLDLSATNSLRAFYDSGEISSYAVTPMRWGVGIGIITGINSNTISPQGTATRAQVASIFMRLVQYYDDDPSNDPAPGVDASSESIQVGGKSYYISMPVSELTSLAGKPDETEPTLAGYTWYFFGTSTYQNFFMAGVYGGKVVTLCATGPGFSYMGFRMGQTGVYVGSTSDCRVSIMTDQNDNNIFHCVLLKSTAYNDSSASSLAEAMAGESRTDFHLVNAFRVYHGLSILKWSDAAAKSGILHSQDMSDQNYFSHTSLDGRTPWQRMEAQGISYTAAGENIAAGYVDAIDVHDGWVNSAGHRENLLTPQFEYVGVGTAGSQRRPYYTEDFYA